MKPLLRCLVLSLCLLPSARAAALWVGGDLSTAGFGAHGGVGVFPVPLLGTLGLEGEVLRPWQAGASSVSLGATLRDIPLPLTRTDAFVGAGWRLGPANALYLQAGLRTPLVGPAGLRWALRAYPGTGEFRAAVGLEARF